MEDNCSFQTVDMLLSCTQILVTYPHALHLENVTGMSPNCNWFRAKNYLSSQALWCSLSDG